jgi:glycosyltransferase involved in cell wall biosynthesis
MKFIYIDRQINSSIRNFFYVIQDSLDEFDCSFLGLFTLSCGSKVGKYVSLFFLPIDLVRVLISVRRADVVCINFADPIFFLFPLIRFCSRTKIIKINHELQTLLSNRLASQNFLLNLWSDHSIFLSDAGHLDFLKSNPVSGEISAKAISHCVSSTLYNYEVRSLAKKDFLYVGRLDSNKNCVVALDWFCELLKFFPNFQFRIIGSGPEKEKLIAKTVRLGIEDKVIFLGDLPHSRVLVELEDSFCLLAPSRSEAFHMVVLEALYLGCKVIASDISAHRDFLSRAKFGITLINTDSLFDPELCVVNSDFRQPDLTSYSFNIFRCRFRSIIHEVLSE